MKKVLAFFLTTIIIISAFAFNSFAADGLTINDANYPTEIVEGNTFSIHGEIRSDNTISKVTCSVTNSAGSVEFSKTAYPDASTFDIHTVDAYMTFSKLSAGNYTYKITASDKNNSNAVLLKKDFNVVKAQGLTLSNANYPTVLYKGEKFTLYGNVNSDRNISTVTMSVTTVSGKACFSYTGKPGTKSYNINNVSYLLDFSTLDVGEYVYKITASDSVQKNVVLLQKNFTVEIRHTAEADLDPVNWNAIDLSVWNDVVSWSKIAQNTDAVILRIGYRGTVNRAIKEDTKFLENYKNATEQSLPVGCYFFSNALNAEEAIEEADFVVNRLKSNGCKLSMPVYIDMETDAQAELSASACTEIANAFCRRIKELGYYPGIYCSSWFAGNEIYYSELADFTFWIAEYNPTCSFTGSYGMWQYSKTGTVPGIDGNVDLDKCYRDYPKFIKANNLNGYEPAVKDSFALKNDAEISDNIIYNIMPEMTADEFTDKYITLTGSAKVSFANLKDSLVRTGSELTVTYSDSTTQKYTVSVLYDIDGNASANATDALLTLKASVGAFSPTSAQKYSADVNKDGKIDSLDALAILKYSVQ